MSSFYGKGKEKFGGGEIDWVNDRIRAFLIDTSEYSVSIDVDEFVNDIPDSAKIAETTLTGKTNSLGVLDADDSVFPSVTGPTCEAIVLWKDTGSAATSPLIVYLDAGTGFPFTPDGSNIPVTWSNDASRICAL